MNRDERIYRTMLRVYPRQFLSAYESEMLVAFRDQQRDAGSYTPWPTLLADIGKSAPLAWRDQLDDDLHTGVAAMKTMALLAILVGCFEALNTFIELNAGGFGGRGAVPLLVLLLAATVGVALIVSGIALMRSGRDAARIATWVAIACLVEFIAMPLTRAGLSGLSTLVGLVFPLLLIGFLAFNRSSRVAS